MKIIRDALMGLILFLIVLYLVSCAPAPTSFDPNSVAIGQRLTAQAAQEQSEYYGALATQTAQAPILAITQQAAALNFSMTQNSIDQTVTAQSWTLTYTPIPTITPSPTANMTATLEQAQVIATTTAMYQKTQRDEMTNTIRAIIIYALVLIGSIVAVMYAYTHMKILSIQHQTVDERGRIIPVINVLDGTVIDIERSANGMVEMSKRFLDRLPAITAERQDPVTRLSQLTDLATRRALPKQLLDNITQPAGLLPAPVNVESEFGLPTWELINSWDGKGLPYYTARGLEIIDTNKFPHLSAIGATGTGKSRRFFRPLIACALVSGHRVIIIGKSTDYWPFEAHPNASLLTVNKITETGQAERYAHILESIIVEMNRRDDYLTSIHKSTWEQAGRNLTYIVLDELGNAFRLMSRETSNQCRIWVEGLVAEGRKFGFNIVLSNQRATGMPAILSQTGRAIFRVDSDEEGRHRSLAGASGLHDGYFLAKFGVPKLAGGFEPSDDQIQQFLSSRPVNKVEDDDQWIDAVATDAPASLSGNNPAELPHPDSLSDFLGKLTDEEAKIIDGYIEQKSLNQIQMDVFGKVGGGYYYTVSKLIERYKAANSNNTNNNIGKTPENQPMPA